jgi:hypothetical protein
MFSTYFEEWDVRQEYKKELVSLWPNWLGEDNLHKLDEVTKDEWARFNKWITHLAQDFTIELVDCEKQSITKVADIESVLSSYEVSMNKDSSLFTKLVLPELGCVISEEWDYTYIIWYKDSGVVEALSPYITKNGLKHFHG